MRAKTLFVGSGMRTNAEGKYLISILKGEDEYDLAETQTDAENIIKAHVTERLTSNQFSALVSLIMCEGREVLLEGNVLEFLNHPAPEMRIRAADIFGFYIYAENDEERYIDPFLAAHRDAEKALFLKPELVRKRKETKRGYKTSHP